MMDRFPKVAAAIAAAVFAIAGQATVSHAADYTLQDAKIVLLQSASGNQLLRLKTRDGSIPMPAGGPDGVLIEVFSSNQGTSGSVSLPAGMGDDGWKARDTRNGMLYRFSNRQAPEGGTAVQKLVLSEGRGLVIKAKDTGLALDGYLGSVGVRVTMGTSRACAKFFGSEAVDRPGRYTAKRSVEFLADCNDLTLGGSAQ